MNNGLIILAILGVIIIAGVLLSFEKTKNQSTNGSSDIEQPTVGDESGLKK